MTRITNKNNVTIIIPVYGDWESLSKCIDSVLKFVATNHEVLFVNDKGPDWQVLGKKIKAKIKGYKHCKYFENKTNLGYVKNCNYAVSNLATDNKDIILLNSDTVVTKGFLEELQAAVYASEEFGVACPRSNNATIASIPINPKTYGRTIGQDEAYKIYLDIKNYLPAISIVPVAVGFCLYIKRSLVDQYGLFNEIYGKGYGEENDFCMSMSRKGQMSIMANRAFVFHQGARSFTNKRRAELVKKHEKLLLKRHPNHDALVANYLEYEIDGIDYYAETYANSKKKKVIHVMVDLHSMPPAEVAETKQARKLIKELTSSRQVKYSVVTSKTTWDYLTQGKTMKVKHIEPHAVRNQYDIGYSVMPVTDVNHALFLRRTCLRIAIHASQKVTYLDTNYRSDPIANYLARLFLNYADWVICTDSKEAAFLKIYLKDYSKRVLIVKDSDKVINQLVSLSSDELDIEAFRTRWELLGGLKLIIWENNLRQATTSTPFRARIKKLLRGG